MKIDSRTVSAWLVVAAALAGALTLPARGAERGPARASVSGLAATPAATPAASTTAVETEARVIVKFKADSSLMRALAARPAVTGAISGGSSDSDGPQHAQALASRLGLVLRDGRVMGPRAQLVLAQGMRSQDLADRLAAQGDVEYAVVDERMRVRAVPNDPLYAAGQATTPVAGQWYLRAPNSNAIVDASSVVAAINAEAAWAYTTGKPGVVVAVLDTGVRPNHPDLAGKLLPGYDFITDAGAANDGSGRDADPSDPGDGVTAADVGVVRGCDTSDIGSSSWHGTQTAGLIGAATNNGVGMASVGRDVLLLPVRVLGKCGGDTSDILDALRWSAGIAVAGVPANPNPAKVINLSFGSTASCSQAYVDVFQQVAAKGVVVVAAAGNEGLAVGSPANCPGVIAVAGVRHAGTKVGYSDLGPEVAISAPAGNCVNPAGTCLYPLLTTADTGVQGPNASSYTDGDSHATLGTSFSSPLVAGTVALMFSANSTLTSGQALNALKSTARSFPSSGAAAGVRACVAPTAVAQGGECYCTTSTCGAGLLDTGAAVALVARVTANIAVASTSVVAGTAVALDGSGSRALPGRTIATYQWALTDGAALASFSSATNAATATLATSAAGSVTVSLTVTDNAGQTDTATTTLAISRVVPIVPPPVPGDPPSSSGGGGAMELGWLLGWLASVIGVYAVTPRPRCRLTAQPGCRLNSPQASQRRR